MKRSAALALLVAASCGGAGITEVPVGQEFTLAVAESAVLRGPDVTVTFVGVPEDSRCPSDVICVWAGNGKVELRIERSGGAATVVALNTTVEPREASLDGYSLQLVALEPSPVSTRRIGRDEYRARLRVGQR